MAKSVKMRQVQLTAPSEHGTIFLTTYVEDVPGLKPKNSITLKDSIDPERLWEIISVSAQARDKKDIKTTWHNI
jgi:hypothetical protein